MNRTIKTHEAKRRFPKVFDMTTLNQASKLLRNEGSCEALQDNFTSETQSSFQSQQAVRTQNGSLIKKNNSRVYTSADCSFLNQNTKTISFFNLSPRYGSEYQKTRLRNLDFLHNEVTPKVITKDKEKVKDLNDWTYSKVQKCDYQEVSQFYKQKIQVNMKIEQLRKMKNVEYQFKSSELLSQSNFSKFKKTGFLIQNNSVKNLLSAGSYSKRSEKGFLEQQQYNTKFEQELKNRIMSINNEVKELKQLRSKELIKINKIMSEFKSQEMKILKDISDVNSNEDKQRQQYETVIKEEKKYKEQQGMKSDTQSQLPDEEPNQIIRKSRSFQIAFTQKLFDDKINKLIVQQEKQNKKRLQLLQYYKEKKSREYTLLEKIRIQKESKKTQWENKSKSYKEQINYESKVQEEYNSKLRKLKAEKNNIKQALIHHLKNLLKEGLDGRSYGIS